MFKISKKCLIFLQLQIFSKIQGILKYSLKLLKLPDYLNFQNAFENPKIPKNSQNSYNITEILEKYLMFLKLKTYC
jgi:hypothetical protein